MISSKVVGRPKPKLAPESVAIAYLRGLPLVQVARDHGLTVSQLRVVLRRHSVYCLGRVEPFMGREKL